MSTPDQPAPKPVWKRWYAIVAYVIVGCVLIFAFASIGGDEEPAAGPASAPAEQEPAEQEPAEPAPDDECEEVDPALAEQIGTQLNSGAKVAEPVQAAAVKSGDFDDVYMVAVVLDIDGSEQTGVWSVGGSLVPGEASGIYAADGIAQEFSDYGSTAGDTEFNAGVDGVNEARACI